MLLVLQTDNREGKSRGRATMRILDDLRIKWRRDAAATMIVMMRMLLVEIGASLVIKGEEGIL